jgi:hypothetical protein
MSNQTQAQNNNPKKFDLKNLNQKQKLTLLTGSFVAILLVVIIAAGLSGNDNQKNKKVNSKDTETVQTEKTPKLPEVSDTGREFFDAKKVEEYQIPKVSEEIAKSRDGYIDFENAQSALPENERINLADIVEGDFNQEKVSQVKQKAEKVKLPVGNKELKPGEETTITVSYSSIGDEAFQEGSLVIKLSQGLEIVPGSIVDKFNGKDIKVSDSVFDSEKRLITYGPGSADKASSAVSVDGSGELKFKVRSTDKNLKEFAITSVLKEKGKAVGQPGFMFLEA